MHINAYIGCNDNSSHYFITTKAANGQSRKCIIGYSNNLEKMDVEIPNLDIHSSWAYTDMILLVDMENNMYRYKYGALTLEGPFPSDCISLDVSRNSKVCHLRHDGLFARTGNSVPQKIGEYALPNTTQVFILNDRRIALFTPGEVLTVVSVTGEIECAYYGIEDMVRLTPDIYCVSVKNDEEGKKAIEELKGKPENGVLHNDRIYFPITVSNNLLSVSQWNGIDVSSDTPCIKSGASFRFFCNRIADRNPIDCIPEHNYNPTRIVEAQPEDFIDLSLDANKVIFTERLYWRDEDGLLRPFAFPICVNRIDDSTYCVLYADGTWQKKDDGNHVMQSCHIEAAYRKIDMVFPYDKYIYWQNKNRLYRVDNYGKVDLSSAKIIINPMGDAEIFYMHCSDMVAVNMFALSKSAQVFDLDSLFKKVIDIDRNELKMPLDPKYSFNKQTFLTKPGLVCFDTIRKVVQLIDKDGVIDEKPIPVNGNAIKAAGLCNIVILCDCEKMLVYDSLQRKIVYDGKIFSNVPSKIEYINNGILVSDRTNIIYLYESQGEIRLRRLGIAGDSFSSGYFEAKQGRLTIFDWRCEAVETIDIANGYEVITKNEM